MTTVSKSALKAKMLEHFRIAERQGSEIIVTDNRVPVLKVVPINKKASVEEVFFDLSGKVGIGKALLHPTTDAWGM